MTQREESQLNARERLALQIKRRRRAAGISQERYAELVGLHRTYIGAIERCERNVSIDNIEKLAQAFGVDVVDMLQGPDFLDDVSD